MRSLLFRQTGQSLIDLMVGMVLMLIITLAMLSLFKTTAKTTAESGQGAQIDGQIAAALLTADRLLQGAGYGYASGTSLYNSQLLAYAGNASVNMGTAASAVVWMSSANTCQAIVASGANLTFYGPASTGYTCTSPTLPINANSSQTLIVAPSVTLSTAPNAGITTITVNSASCTPYGTGSTTAAGYASGSYSVTLSTVAYVASSTLQSTTCLVNYH